MDDPANEPGDVWPPTPTVPPPRPVHSVSAQMFTAGGPVSDFRAGTLCLDADGIDLDGRAAIRAEIAFPLCLLGALFFFVGAVLVALILELVGRPDRQHIPWRQVQRVVLAPRRQRVCLVYEAPDHRGMPRSWSLTFQFAPAAYAPFLEEMAQYAPGRAAEGPLRRWAPAHVWVFIAPILALAIVFIVLAAVLGLLSLHTGP